MKKSSLKSWKDSEVISMLVTDVEDKMKCDNFKMLVTVLAVLVINIHYCFTLASGTYI